MRDPRQMMIDRQAQIITDQRSTIDRLHAQNQSLKSENARLRKSAETYDTLVEQVLSNPTLQAEWDRFLSFLKMAGDEKYLKENGAFSNEG
jgi:predicted RNase H-like nuclease (RuvC/YqgF family)